jgi:hypothetical protein
VLRESMPFLMRIVDIADQLDCTTGLVLTACDELGIAADTGASLVSEGDAARIADHVVVMATRVATVPAGPAPLAPPPPVPLPGAPGFQLPPSAAIPQTGSRVVKSKTIRVLVGLAIAGGYAAWRAGALDLFTTQAEDLAVGDCVAFPNQDIVTSDSSVEIGRNLDTQDCSQPHDLRVLSTSDLPALSPDRPSAVAFPGTESPIWFDHCVAELPAGTQLDAGRDIYALYPTVESWGLGDRQVVCFEGTVDGSQLPPVAA